MTPREHKEYLLKESEKAKKMSEEWHPRLSRGLGGSLKRNLSSMDIFRLSQEDVPLIIKLVENPKYFTSRLFTGAVDLFTHDCIHILLGRGVLLKDEAFVIGYTMGSSQKMKRWRRNLFMFCTKYLYPEGYKFGEEERFVFNMGVYAGSKCKKDLSTFDFKEHLDKHPNEIRGLMEVSVQFLESCYQLEKNFFPDSIESQRLI